ncbi:hypothetical protein HAX54_035507, partial [Datura stramonium]|nr:hypothetical protein [Datura stramonium]
PKLRATSKSKILDFNMFLETPEKYKFFSEKIVFILVGLFLFMGLRAKHVFSVSQPVQEWCFTELRRKIRDPRRNSEEERD